MSALKYVGIGVAAVLVADMVAKSSFAVGKSPATANLIRLAAGGAAVWAAHKWVLKTA